MQKNNTDFAPRVSYTEQTPNMLIGQQSPDPLYEKAFLSREPISDTAYSQNTTTHD